MAPLNVMQRFFLAVMLDLILSKILLILQVDWTRVGGSLRSEPWTRDRSLLLIKAGQTPLPLRQHVLEENPGSIQSSSMPQPQVIVGFRTMFQTYCSFHRKNT